MLIEYKGHRPRHIDKLYGTGAWTPGAVKDVPDDAGHKLLRHPDMFQPGKAAEGKVEVVAKAESTGAAKALEEERRAQEARDTVAAMQDKQAVLDFALTNYRRKLDARQKLDVLKRQATMLIDQYGVQ